MPEGSCNSSPSSLLFSGLNNSKMVFLSHSHNSSFHLINLDPKLQRTKTKLKTAQLSTFLHNEEPRKEIQRPLPACRHRPDRQPRGLCTAPHWYSGSDCLRLTEALGHGPSARDDRQVSLGRHPVHARLILLQFVFYPDTSFCTNSSSNLLMTPPTKDQMEGVTKPPQVAD